MAEQIRTLSNFHPAMLIATWFGSGLARVAPGTCGSLAALPFAWLITMFWGVQALFVAAAAIFCIGYISCTLVMRHRKEKDPQIIVVDEVAGQWLTLSAAPLDPVYYFLGFVLFRVADISKIWPASWIDRSLSGAAGVMLDDAIAGIYAATSVFIIFRIIG